MAVHGTLVIYKHLKDRKYERLRKVLQQIVIFKLMIQPNIGNIGKNGKLWVVICIRLPKAFNNGQISTPFGKLLKTNKNKT